jgi:hypothetical protein
LRRIKGLIATISLFHNYPAGQFAALCGIFIAAGLFIFIEGEASIKPGYTIQQFSSPVGVLSLSVGGN